MRSTRENTHKQLNTQLNTTANRMAGFASAVVLPKDLTTAICLCCICWCGEIRVPDYVFLAR